MGEDDLAPAIRAKARAEKMGCACGVTNAIPTGFGSIVQCARCGAMRSERLFMEGEPDA